MAIEDSKTDRRTLAQAIAEGAFLSGEQAAVAVLQLLKFLETLHSGGQIHRKITPETVFLSQEMNCSLRPAETTDVSLGGADPNAVPCPLPLQNARPLSVPAEISAAEQILTQSGILLDPRQIDFYQLGGVLCFMVSGHEIGDYLRSCRAKADVPKPLQPIIDTALGLNHNDSFPSASAFADKLESLINGSADKTTAIPQLPKSIFPESETASTSAAGEEELPFETLAHYKIIGRIGHGGMGDVYKAYEESLERFVAIKVLPAELSRQKDFIKRFQVEAAAIAQLDHPNVVRIYYCGSENGHHFFVMQYVEGESLAEILARRGTLSIDESLSIIKQCLAGLSAVHQCGLIHRDIKPGNILIDHQSRKALLTDFGIVKSDLAETHLTVTGSILGTVDCIAPEQARSSKIDCRADLYAMGILMYQMLSGKLPFNATSATSMMFQHAYEPPAPLSETAPEIPEALADIVMKLLAKEPDNRYQTAEDLLTALENLDLNHISSSVQTGIIETPLLDTAPLPENLTSLAGSSPLKRLKNLLFDFFRIHTSQIIDSIQTTTQQIDGAIAQYERQREHLAGLLKESRVAASELAEQANASRNTAQAAALLAENATTLTAKQKALKEKQDNEQSMAELAQLAAEQAEQAEQTELQLAKLDAKLAQLRSQRDALNARMNVVHAQLKSDPPKSSKWICSKRLNRTVVIFVLACFAAALIYIIWPIVQEDDSLVAHWTFDEGSGTIAHDSAGNNHGTVYGAKWVSGKIGGALSFPGNGYVEVPDSDALDLTDQITIAAWVKAAKIQPTSHARIVCKYVHPVSGYACNISVKNAFCGGFRDTESMPHGISGTTSINDNIWHHCVLTFDSKNLKVYVDGVLENSENAEGYTIKPNDRPLRIGQTPNPTENQIFKGVIDEVRIYNRSLSAKEIQKLFGNQIQSPASPEPIAHWTFDEGSGTIAYDSAGNNNGTIHGAAWIRSETGGALQFNGKDSYVMISASDVFDFGDGDFSVSAWFKTSVAKDQFIVRFNGAPFVETYINSESYIGSYTATSTKEIRLLDKSKKYNDGQWHHLAITMENGERNGYRLFVDGAIAESLSCSGSFSNFENLTIGANPKGTWNKHFFNGLIDEVQIYNRALTDEQIQQLYQDQVQLLDTPAPIAHWTFDEGSGIIAHDSAGNNNGTIHGATWIKSETGGALSFDGTDDYVSCGSSADLDLTEFTWSLWIKRAEASYSDERALISTNGPGKRTKGTYSMQIDVNGNLQNKIYLARHGSSVSACLWSQKTVGDTEWHHIAATRNSNAEAVIYIDGVPDVRGKLVKRTAFKEFVIGAGVKYYSSFKGIIDDVRVYDKALSDQQIQQLYLSTLDTRPALSTVSKDESISPVGTWKSIDLVQHIEDFQPNQKSWKGSLFLQTLIFEDDEILWWTNNNGGPYKHRWKDRLIDPDQERPVSFNIQDINGDTYLFMEWISGDVTLREQEPCYYVLKKVPVSKAYYAYIVSFGPVSPFAPQTARELLSAFNQNHPSGVRTHHYRTKIEDEKLVGFICVDNKNDAEAIEAMLKQSDALEFIYAKAVTQQEFEEYCQQKQVSLSSDSSSIYNRISQSPVIFVNDLSVDGIVIKKPDCTTNFVLSLLGPPERIDYNGRMLRYPEYGFDLLFSGQGPLSEIHLNRGFKGKLDTGISMTSSKQDVFNAYGKPLKTIQSEKLSGQNDESILYQKENMSRIYYGKHGLIFWFMDDEIHQIVPFRGLLKSNIIVPGMRVGGYRIGMSKKEVLTILGKTQEEALREGKSSISVNGLILNFIDDIVNSIDVLSSRYKFVNGLRIGDSEQEIKQTFGDDFRTKETQTKDFLIYKNEGLQFEIHKNNRTIMEFTIIQKNAPELE